MMALITSGWMPSRWPAPLECLPTDPSQPAVANAWGGSFELDRAALRAEEAAAVSHGLQLQYLWRIHAAAVSQHGGRRRRRCDQRDGMPVEHPTAGCVISLVPQAVCCCSCSTCGLSSNMMALITSNCG